MEGAYIMPHSGVKCDLNLNPGVISPSCNSMQLHDLHIILKLVLHVPPHDIHLRRRVAVRKILTCTFSLSPWILLVRRKSRYTITLPDRKAMGYFIAQLIQYLWHEQIHFIPVFVVCFQIFLSTDWLLTRLLR